MGFDYDLRRIKTKEQLQKFLGIEGLFFDDILQFDPSEVTKICDDQTHIIARLPSFFQHKIPKRNRARGYRIVWEVSSRHSDTYKAFARRLNVFLSKAMEGYPHPNAYGYVKGRNIRENASQHSGKRFLLITDIENFFPSIKTERIVDLFEKLGVERDIAVLLGEFLSIGGELPLGLPPSPSISNAICIGMDKELTEMAEFIGATYTRYADDITFSSDVSFPDVAAVSAVLERHCFTMARDKTRQSKLGQAHYVTGLSVSDKKAPHTPRVMKKALRQELYFAKRFGLSGHLERLGIIDNYEKQRAVNRLDGLVKYVSYHEPNLAPQLYRDWQRILEESDERPSFAPKNQGRVGFSLFFDESEIVWKNERYLALGISVSQHQDRIDSVAKNVLEDFLANPWSDGKRDAFLKNGLHYNDATEDLTLKYVEAMQTMPFNGYVAFAKYSDPLDYQETYLRILRAVITRRLMAAESRFALLSFEENSKVSLNQIKDVVESAYQELVRRNNRRPLHYRVEVVSKRSCGVSVPDFLLGVLGKYLKSGKRADTQPTPREYIMFERLRDKYRLILDVDSSVEYSRRNPIEPW